MDRDRSCISLLSFNCSDFHLKQQYDTLKRIRMGHSCWGFMHCFYSCLFIFLDFTSRKDNDCRIIFKGNIKLLEKHLPTFLIHSSLHWIDIFVRNSDSFRIFGIFMFWWTSNDSEFYLLPITYARILDFPAGCADYLGIIILQRLM